MPQTCPHCGTALPAVVDAYCPECREDLSATPEEAEENAPTFEKIAEAAEPFRVAWAGLIIAIGVVSSVVALLAGVATRELEAAGCGVIGLAVCGYWAHKLYRRVVVKTSVTATDKFPKDCD